MRAGALWQEMYRSQYFEGGRVLTAAISAHRHRAPRHQGQGAGRAGLPAARRQAARPRADLRHHLGRAGAGDDRAGASCSWSTAGPASASSCAGARRARPLFEPRESIAVTAHWLVEGARGARATTSCSASTTTTACRVAEAASFCQKMPSGTLDFLEEPIRDETPEAYESLRTHDRRAVRHRRGVLLASGSSCPTSSAASTSSTASTSAMSAASPRR